MATMAKGGGVDHGPLVFFLLAQGFFGFSAVGQVADHRQHADSVREANLARLDLHREKNAILAPMPVLDDEGFLHRPLAPLSQNIFATGVIGMKIEHA